MKKILRIKFLLPVIIVIFVFIAFKSQEPYRDGTYEGRSRAKYIYEPYVGMVKLEIKDGYISKIDFKIVDTINNEIFDEGYEKHFIGNDKYIQQCRNDWQGVQDYPKKLLSVQDIDRLDAVSGATWSYNIFKASTIQALDKARK